MISSLTRWYRNVFPRGLTTYPATGRVLTVPITLHPCQQLIYLIIAILAFMRWYFIVALVLHFPDNAEHLFMCLRVIWVSSSAKRSGILLISLLGCFIYLLLLIYRLCLCILDTSRLVICIGKSPRFGFSFYSLFGIFWLTEVWKFNMVDYHSFSFLVCAFCVLCKKSVSTLRS